MIDTKTRLCAILGDPVEHSLSPLIHNAAFSEVRLNYVYLAFQVRDIEKAIAGVRGLGFKGLSVTLPHKVAVMEHLDLIEPLAEKIGAVNTIVVNSRGRLIGYNTDGPGALKALQSAGTPLQDAKVLLIGSGGAARSVAFILATQGTIASLTLTDVQQDPLDSLVKDLRDKTGVPVQGHLCEPAFYEKEISNATILINTSPVGMSPRVDESPIPGELLHSNLTVFDVIYNPFKTRLLKEAEDAGCRIVSGVEMFIEQAIAQFELWTSVSAPAEKMRRVVFDLLKESDWK